MNVTKDNVDQACDEFARLVPTAAFVAMDLEMTGIHLPDCKDLLSDTPAARYSKMRRVASRFNVIQVGLTMFHRVGGGEDADDIFLARTYNVFTFPARGQITLEGGAVDFLTNTGMMDWNKWFRDGVPYLRKAAAEELRAKMFPDEAAAAANATADTAAAAADKKNDAAAPAAAASKAPIELDRPDDIAFCNDALAGVAAWWARGANDDDCPAEHALPPCNSYLRRYLFQELERLYGGEVSFSVESRVLDAARHWEKTMVAMRLSEAEREAKAKAELAEKEATYRSRLGFRRMWTALTDASRPLVVHNGLYDLLFVCEHMHGELPPSLSGFKALVGKLFPGGVFDTRTIAGKLLVDVYPENEEGGDDEEKEEAAVPSKRPMFPELRLDRVYGVCKSEVEKAAAAAANGDGTKTRINVSFAQGHGRYRDATKAILHEAGYDSYITAFSFAYMRRAIEAQQGGAAAQMATASVKHLAESRYVLPMYRSFFPGVCLAPGSEDTILRTAGEQQHVLSGFPKDFQTSDVLRMFTAPPAAKDSSDGGDGDSDKPRVSLRWINDDSVCVRFGDADAKTVLANLEAHRASACVAAEGDNNAVEKMVVTPLDAYLRTAEAELASATDGEDEKGRGGKRTATLCGSVDVVCLAKKKAKMEN